MDHKTSSYYTFYVLNYMECRISLMLNKKTIYLFKN